MSGSEPVKASKARLGLRSEVLLSLGVLMGGAVAVLGAASLAASERLLLSQRENSLTQTAYAMGRALSAASAPGRGETLLETTVVGLSRGLALDALVVADEKGRILAGSREERRGMLSSDPALRSALATGRLVTPGEAGGRPGDLSRSWTFAAPLPAGPGLRGAFSVSFPVEDLRDARRVHRLSILVFALLDIAIILIFGNFLLGRVAVHPLQGMARAARQLAGGERGARAPVEGSREVASLAESFNEMAQKVEESANQQERHLADLTRANATLRVAREELVRSEKLASVGRLAAGVAHEIGNPLSAILGYTGLLLREKPQGEAAEYLGYIERETERIRRIIGDLLEFSRPGEVSLEDLDVNELARSALDLVRPQKELLRVEIVFRPGEGLPRVRGDRHQLSQVLINLFLNAAQAMAGEGRLTVTTAGHVLADGEALSRRRRSTDGPGRDPLPRRRDPLPGLPRSVVRITVRDSGPGIPPELSGRVFDPFFTTKPPGQGTGLGLWIAYGIVSAHHGILRVGANPDARGAEFVIDLPVAP